MQHDARTSGERLAVHIHNAHMVSDEWSRLAPSIAITGRQTHYARYFRELAAVTVACRLVSYADGLAKRGKACAGMSEDDSDFTKQLSWYLREHLGLYDTRSRDRLHRLVIDALKASRADASESTKSRMQSQCRRAKARCYMCGQALQYDGIIKHAQFTVDHSWPRCFGGESDDDNLLPACDSCNSGKKRHFATWAMVAVQSVALGWNPTAAAFTSVDGTVKFALHNLAVWQLASKERLSLKQAYLKLGPWESLRVLDTDGDADFFNLAIHSEFSGLNLE